MAKKSKRQRAQRALPAAIAVKTAIEAAIPDREADDDLAGAFFESPPSLIPVEIEVAEAPPSPAAVLSPHVHARRARFTRFVGGVVVAGLAICVVALTRVAIAGAGGLREHPTVSANAAPRVAAEAPKTHEREIAEKTADPAPVESAAPIKPNASEGAALARRAQIALEGRHVAAAIEDAERATALAPTEPFPWLVLGAAYEAKGDLVEARRSYRMCKDRSAGSSFNECAALLLR